ncbi:uncharacterized protein LOC142353189 isoform X4 [Convolutriloba macropyga]|uniref:uncharacterized protein LOC142353189 isoform X4 n=1 Tax=Convolutriloba macropyga TaxID=536237 RepID=UPI003F526BC0
MFTFFANSFSHFKITLFHAMSYNIRPISDSTASKSDHSLQRSATNAANFLNYPPHQQQNLPTHQLFNFSSPQEYYLNHRRVYQSNPASSLSLSAISNSPSPTPANQPIGFPLSPHDTTVTQQHSSRYQSQSSYAKHSASSANQVAAGQPSPNPSQLTDFVGNSGNSHVTGGGSYHHNYQLVTPAVSTTVPSRTRVTPRRSVSAYRMAVANAAANNNNKELLKILAEVFRIGPEKQLMSEQQQQAAPTSLNSSDPSKLAPEWEKLSESLVPITVVIMEETPVCVLHVTGIMFPDKKILDSKVFNPGTKITRTTNCFVQWSDRTKGGLWGLNFISEKDALRFITCCSPASESPTRVPNNPNASLYPSQPKPGPGYHQSSTPPSPSRRMQPGSPKHQMHPADQFRPSSCVQMEESVQMVGDMLFIKTGNNHGDMQGMAPVSSANMMNNRHNSRQSPMVGSSVAHWNNTGMPGHAGYPQPVTGSNRTRSLTPVGGALHGHSLSLSSGGAGGSRYASPVPPQFYPQPSPRSDSPLSVSSNGSCSRHTCGKPLPGPPHRMSSPLPPPSYFQQPYPQYQSSLSNDGSSQGYNPNWNYPDGQRSSISYTQECIYGSMSVVPGTQMGMQNFPPDVHRGYPPPHLHSHSNSSSNDNRNFSPDHLPSPTSMFNESQNYKDRSGHHQQASSHRRKGSEGNPVGTTIPPHLGPLQTSAPNDGTGSPFLPRGFRGEKLLPNPQNLTNDDAVVYSELFAIMKSKDSRPSPCSTGPTNTLERANRSHPIIPPRIPTSYAYPGVGYPSSSVDPDLLSLNDGESGVNNETGDRPKPSTSQTTPAQNVEGFGGIPMLNDTKQDNDQSPDTESPDFNDDLPPPTQHQMYYPNAANLLQLSSGANYMNLNIKPMPPHSSHSGLNRSVISSEGFVSPGSEMTHVSDQGFSIEDVQNSKRDSTVSQTDSGFEGHHGAGLSAAGSENQFGGVPQGASQRKGSSACSSHSSIAKRESNPLMQASPAKTSASDSSTTSSNKASHVTSALPAIHPGHPRQRPDLDSLDGRVPLADIPQDLNLIASARRPDSSCGGSQAGSDRSSTRSGTKGSSSNVGGTQCSIESGTQQVKMSAGGGLVIADGTFFNSSGASIDNLTDDSHSNSSKGMEETVRSFVDCNESLSEDNHSETSEISRQLGPGFLDLGSGNGASSAAEFLGMRPPPGTLPHHNLDPSGTAKPGAGHEEEEDNCVDPTDATFRRFGVTRKAGWLEIKHVLFLNSKKKKLETAPKRKWKRYWACLKGHSMLFYSIQTELPSIDENSVPELVLGIENSIAQPIPEHPKRENVFSLSTFHGNVYLCEAQSTAELENWITAVHSCCANAIVLRGQQANPGKPSSQANSGSGGQGGAGQGQSGNPGDASSGSTVSIVTEEVRKCEQRIDMDLKMKKMAELQLSIMNDHKTRQAVELQITSWEQNLEQLNCDLYRLKCYASSLQGTELPNPRTLLSAVSKETKMHLSRLNVFSASSVHALLSGKCVLLMEQEGAAMAGGVISGNESTASGSLERGRRKMYHHSNNREVSSSRDSQKSSVANQQNSVANRNSQEAPSSRSSSAKKTNQVEPPRHNQSAANDVTSATSKPSYLIPPNSAGIWENLSKGKLARVFLPHNQKTVEAVIPQMTVNELLLRCCRKRRLDPRDHFIRIRAPDRTWVIPSPKSTLESLNCQDIEVCIKEYHAVTLSRVKGERFGIEYETVEEHFCATNTKDSNSSASTTTGTTTGYPRLFVRDILPGSIAQSGGLEPGDEILQINNHIVGKQNPQHVDDLLKVDLLHLVIRSLRPSTAPCPQCKEHLEPDGPNVSHFKRSSFYGEENLMLGDKRKSNFSDNSNNSSSGIASGSNASASGGVCESTSSTGSQSGGQNSSTLTGSGSSGIVATANSQGQVMKDATRLGCLIQELISTEENYIKDLKFLIETYLEPLLQCSFLIDIEVEAVTSNVQEILSFQEKFCGELKSSVELEPEYCNYQDIVQFKSILIKLSNAFKCYTDHFKLYSAFCANHSKAQRVFAEVKDVPEFRDMLDQKNPEQEHSRSLESFLIKPIQRVLKYPLILREIKTIVGGGSSTPSASTTSASGTSVAGSDQSECTNVAMAAEFEGLSSALRAMENVAEHINDMKRIHEQYGPVFEQLISEQETKYIHELPMDELLMYGSACWANCPDELVPRKLRNNNAEIDVMIFVFKRAVIILPGLNLLQNKEKQKKRRLTLPGPEKNKTSEQEVCKVRSLIPVSTISLCKEKKDELPKKFHWELISSRTEFHICKNQHFQMLSRSGETRRQFVRAIVRCVHDLMKAQQEMTRNLTTLSRTSNERRIRRSNSQHSTRNPYQNRSSNDSSKNDQSQHHYSNSQNNPDPSSQNPTIDPQSRLIASTPLENHPPPQHQHHNYPPHISNHHHHQLDLDAMPRAIIPTYYPPLTEGTAQVTLPSQLGSHVLVSSQDIAASATAQNTSELSRKAQADSGVFLEEPEQHYVNTSSPNSSTIPDTAPFIPPRPMSTVPYGGFSVNSSTSTAAALLSPSEFRNRPYSPMNNSNRNSSRNNQHLIQTYNTEFSNSRTSAA